MLKFISPFYKYKSSFARAVREYLRVGEITKRAPGSKDNIRSRKIIEASGGKLIDRYFIKRNGKKIPVLRFGILVS